MPDLACPSCQYNLSHLEGEALLTCPECGKACTKREAMDAPYEQRRRDLDLAKCMLIAGPILVLLSVTCGVLSWGIRPAAGVFVAGFLVTIGGALLRAIGSASSVGRS